MDRASQYAIFQAQTANVRKLASASWQVRRTINSAIRRNDVASEGAHTLVLVDDEHVDAEQALL